MKAQPKYHLLTTNLFLLGLVVLLLNDFYLKYRYPGIITGKLSDIAGLFIFPFFIAVFISRPILAYYFTAVFFIFWKLGYSQPFIDAAVKLTGLNIGRVVDVTDLLALAVLPLSYRYLRWKQMEPQKRRLMLSMIVSFCALFSFCATTQPRQLFHANIRIDKTYRLPMSKQKLINRLTPGYRFNDSLQRNVADSTFYLYYRVPEYWTRVTAVAQIKAQDNTTIIKLDSVTDYMVTGAFFGIRSKHIKGAKKMTNTDFTRYFEQNYIDVLLQKAPGDSLLFFDNKKQLDDYQAGKNR
jgi:hypothetical protein